MKIQAMTRLDGLRIELSLDECLQIAKDPQGGADRVRSEVRSMLNGCGIDPDTGDRKASILDRQTSIAGELPSPAAPAEKGSLSKGRGLNLKTAPCQFCGVMYSIGNGGVKRHEYYCVKNPKNQVLDEEDVEGLKGQAVA